MQISTAPNTTGSNNYSQSADKFVNLGAGRNLNLPAPERQTNDKSSVIMAFINH